MEAALERGAAAEPARRAPALMASGLAAHAQGDYAHARARFADVLAIRRAEGRPGPVGEAAGWLASAHVMLGDLAEADALLAEAEALLRAEPPSVRHGFMGYWRAYSAYARGDLAAAGALADEYRRLGERIGHPIMTGHFTTFLGRVALAAGAPDRAAAHLAAALRTHAGVDDQYGIALDLEALAWLAVARGRDADAARLGGAAEALRERLAVAVHAIDRPEREARLAGLAARLGADHARLTDEGRALAPGAALALGASVAA
jgi:tetratricopeptide (TPR) repeat protein